MLVDARSLPEATEIAADFCIVGAGAAGIVLALELQRLTTARIAVIEAGGLHTEPEVDETCEAADIGHRAIKLDVNRLKVLGGSTGHWGGNCAPLDPIDFEVRPWVPHSGWPITKEEIDRHFDQAQTYCGLMARDYSVDFWRRRFEGFAAVQIPLAHTAFDDKIFQRMPTRFGEHYRPDLAREDTNTHVYLNAHALALESNDVGSRVNALRVGCLDGKRHKVLARHFVLAAGIENARLLLLSNDIVSAGLGNQYDQVGRYLIGHLNTMSGFAMLRKHRELLDYYNIETDTLDVHFSNGLQLRPEVQAREQVLNYVCFLYGMWPSDEITGMHAVRELSGIFRGRPPSRSIGDNLAQIARDFPKLADHALERIVSVGFGHLQHFFEQAPNPHSRIRLSQERDALGINRIAADWRFTELDKRTLVRAQNLLSLAFGQVGVGRIAPEMTKESDPWPDNLQSSGHFMGTTRMSDDPRHGVVDRNCRVHGIGNLFIAGGSVFPTAGATMVTCNIVALAIRLAIHLRTVLHDGAVDVR